MTARMRRPTGHSVRTALLIAGPLALFLTSGCGPADDEAPEPDPAAERVEPAPGDPAAGPAEGPARDPEPLGFPIPVPASTTGHLLVVDGAVAFLPCGSDQPRSLRDRTGSEASSIVEELGYGDGGVLAAVVVEGDELAEVRYATPEGPGCERLLWDGQIVAMGNEPFWSLRVDAGEVRWATPEEMDGIVYRPGAWEEFGPDRWTLTAEPTADPARGAGEPEARAEVAGDASVGGAIRLELTRERCADTMAGARFPFSARVDREGRSYEGCAVEGRRAQPNR